MNGGSPQWKPSGNTSPTWLYKLGGRLDKQYEEIVSALSDINAFNAGKKRDKALDLLSAWLPDVEKFSKEIGKQQAYIDSLKERIGQESDYAGRMRDEKYEQELKVQKATRGYLNCREPTSRWGGCCQNTARSVGRIAEKS